MSKSGAAIATMRHANTSDNVMVHARPMSNLGAAEHQMMQDEGQMPARNVGEMAINGTAAVTDLN
jgi:hypothetical protein